MRNKRKFGTTLDAREVLRDQDIGDLLWEGENDLALACITPGVDDAPEPTWAAEAAGVDLSKD